jgi:hypothetical protein
MNIQFREPTIDELLGDSLTQTVMLADKVDILVLRNTLKELASLIDRRRGHQHLPAVNAAPIQFRPLGRLSKPGSGGIAVESAGAAI